MFRFRLQQVLNLREEQERNLASQLVNALGAEQTAQQALDGLRAVREAGAEGVPSGQSKSVGELSNLAFILEQIDGQIANANDAVAAAEVVVTEVKEALTSAFKDRRVLDRLRERHQESHRASADQSDRRTMDDAALTRYMHNGNQ